MTNQEEALQILNETDKLGILHKDSLGESVAISCIVKAMNEKDAQFKVYLEKKRDYYMRHREMWQQDSFEWFYYDSQIDTIDEILNELFGE